MVRHAEVAIAFASALVRGDFVHARKLLTPSLREEFLPEVLQARVYGMYQAYASGEPKRIWFDEQQCLMSWPCELPTDVGSVYVGIEGDDFVEAITVTITELEGEHLIREILWGRP